MRPSAHQRLPDSFAWLNVTQFLGAMNDNLFKLLVVFMLVTLMGEAHKTVIVTTASAIFVVPFLLFAHAGGVLADRFSKQRVVVAMKGLEVVVMALGVAAVARGRAPALYAVLFLMCAQSALFGPSKYGLIPELVRREQLSKANGVIVGATYMAIIIGTFVPSFLLLHVFARSFLSLAWFCLGIAAAGTLASLGIEPTAPRGRQARFSPCFPAELFRTLRETARDRDLFLAILGAAYFTFAGAFLQQNALLYGSDFLGLDWIASGYLFPVAAVGIALGGLLAGRLSGRNIEFGIVPLGALGLTVASLGLGVAAPAWHTVLPLLLLAGISAGLFIVPLEAFIQHRSPPERRGAILAASSFLSFSGVALSAGVLLLLARLGLKADGCFVFIGLTTVLLVLVAVRALPDFLVRFVIVLLTRSLYRIRVTGLENVPLEGGALLVANHVTRVDALLLGATQQRRIRFVMGREIAEHHWLRPLFRLMRVIPVSPRDGPRRVLAALRDARQALDDGYLVCIFAEGALTRTGNMSSFKPGLERILKGSSHPVIPVYIGGAWGSIFSYCYGRLLGGRPRRLPYPVSVHFGRPLPSTVATHEVRQAVSELAVHAFDLQKDAQRSLARQFVRVARRRWFREAVADSTGKRLTYGRALAAATALAAELDRLDPGAEAVGILLPASAGGALANLAVTLAGRTAVNLNFTASRQALASAVAQSGIRTILSARAFLARLEGGPPPDGTVYLEDILPRLTPWKRLRALLKALCWPASRMSRRRAGPDDVATVIFSSGTTGEPKGVMLSHHNILSNIEGFRTVMRFECTDRMCGVLPLFHSFGYTCTLWCPLLTGFSVCYHANPLDGAKIAELVRAQGLTILLATPTFLLNYIRRAAREDFASLRLVVVGAEKLKPAVAEAFERKFGLAPLEGYGTTEIAPVGAVNVPDVDIDGVRQVGVKRGSIGHPIPGVTMRVVDPVSHRPLSGDREGLLMVRGPNVMLGYLRNPEKTAEVLREAWYDTGDIGRMDPDGFVFLSGRLSRYSKIGGEMVPHLAVEERILDALQALHPIVAVTAADDERKGEQLMLFYTDEAGDAESLHAIVRDCDLPNLWKPRRENFIRIEALPALGSGKLDLKRLKDLAQEFVQARAAAPEGAA